MIFYWYLSYIWCAHPCFNYCLCIIYAYRFIGEAWWILFEILGILNLILTQTWWWLILYVYLICITDCICAGGDETFCSSNFGKFIFLWQSWVHYLLLKRHVTYLWNSNLLKSGSHKRIKLNCKIFCESIYYLHTFLSIKVFPPLIVCFWFNLGFMTRVIFYLKFVNTFCSLGRTEHWQRPHYSPCLFRWHGQVWTEHNLVSFSFLYNPKKEVFGALFLYYHSLVFSGETQNNGCKTICLFTENCRAWKT